MRGTLAQSRAVRRLLAARERFRADDLGTIELPLHRPTSNSEETPIKTVTQFEMGILDSLGMLKVDFLGLATLTIMQRACDLIEQRTGKRYNLDNIPLNDPETFTFIAPLDPPPEPAPAKAAGVLSVLLR